MRKLLCLILLFFAAIGCCGCMSQQKLNARLLRIKHNHNVTVKVENKLSQCPLFGNLNGLLDRIETDLENCPQYFKDNIGPVYIEEVFADNPQASVLAVLIRGYVSIEEKQQKFPIHIKNRSLAEKILLWAPAEKELFLHEASHSFEFNIGTYDYDRWLKFYEDFNGARPTTYGGLATSLTFMALPPVGFIRPKGMPSFYATVNHFEDFAETHCYLRNRNIEKLKDKALYKKCKIVQKFVSGGYNADP